MSHDASPDALPIWLVDDDPDVRESLSQWLEISELAVRSFARGQAALEALQAGDACGVLVSDVKMPGLDGLALLRALQALEAPPPVVLITGHGDVPMAVEAMQAGAWDFVEKPFEPERLEESVRRGLERRRLALENRRLRQALREGSLGARLLGQAPGMVRLRQQLANLATTRANVLVLGETGSGKEVVARCLHETGGAKGPFVALNCGAIASELIESELFGHERGAFTGARERKKGRFELAHGGTLFLDEVGDMSGVTQAKLLRVLQEQEFERVGGTETLRVDVRFIAATNRDLEGLVDEGTFREDLYYRLKVVPVPVPSLRERAEDIPALTAHFLRAFAERWGKPVPEVTDDALAVVQSPGIDVVVELIGGLELPFTLIRLALVEGKSVITANKEVVATHGPELAALARDHGVGFFFEGAVAGGGVGS